MTKSAKQIDQLRRSTLGILAMLVTMPITGCAARVPGSRWPRMGLTPPQLVAGANNTMVVFADGSLWAWGDNARGQLGDRALGLSLPTPLRIELSGVRGVQAGLDRVMVIRRDGSVQNLADSAPVHGLRDIVALAINTFHALALRADGSVWAWGSNSWGQLGDGTEVVRTTPVQVVGLADVTAVAAGIEHSVALKRDGSVWEWGRHTSSKPVQVRELVSIIAIACGSNHTVALKEDGTVWEWGGAQGDGRYNHSTDVRVIPRLSDVVSVTASHALRADGSVWRLGQPPVRVRGLSGVVALSSGFSHSVALAADGTLWAWGRNYEGQLGIGVNFRTSPAQVPGLARVNAVAAGRDHTVALGSDGSVWAWGDNHHGQLGDGTFTNRAEPVRVRALRDAIAIAASSGDTTAAMTTDAGVWIWGDIDTDDLHHPWFRSTPLRASELDGGVNSSRAWVWARNKSHVVDQWCGSGEKSTIEVRADGSVWTRGVNERGQLADGTTVDRAEPVRVLGLNQVVSVAVGECHVAALKADGTVWTWGNGTDGQLGEGTTAYRETPVRSRFKIPSSLQQP